MSPEHVVVKGFKGIALNRWMVGTYRNVAIITDDGGVEAVRLGAEPHRSVGFPKCDVFVSPDHPVKDGSVPNWSEMRPRF
jgi:hypothetical protein